MIAVGMNCSGSYAPELHDRPITRDASGRVRIDNTSGTQNAMRNQNREVIPFNEDIAYQNKLYVAEMGSAIDVVEDDYRRFMTKISLMNQQITLAKTEILSRIPTLAKSRSQQAGYGISLAGMMHQNSSVS